MKLELKHLAPYLPYGLRIILPKSGRIIVVAGLLEVVDEGILVRDVDGSWLGLGLWHFTPILRPLSDLTKEIEHNGERFVPKRVLKEMPDPIGGFHTDRLMTIVENPQKWSIEVANYAVVQKLIEWHFDVFGLIENGLAIDINTLNP